PEAYSLLIQAESVNDFIAGYVSGVAGLVIGSPLDILKVRLQASSTATIWPADNFPKVVADNAPLTVDNLTLHRPITAIIRPRIPECHSFHLLQCNLPDHPSLHGCVSPVNRLVGRGGSGYGMLGSQRANGTVI